MVFSLSYPPNYLSNVLKAQQKVKFIYVLSISVPLMRIGLYILLLPLGIWGIVLATIATYSANGVLFIGAFIFYLRRSKLENVAI